MILLSNATAWADEIDDKIARLTQSSPQLTITTFAEILTVAKGTGAGPVLTKLMAALRSEISNLSNYHEGETGTAFRTLSRPGGTLRSDLAWRIDTLRDLFLAVAATAPQSTTTAIRESLALDGKGDDRIHYRHGFFFSFIYPWLPETCQKALRAEFIALKDHPYSSVSAMAFAGFGEMAERDPTLNRMNSLFDGVDPSPRTVLIQAIRSGNERTLRPAIIALSKFPRGAEQVIQATEQLLKNTQITLPHFALRDFVEGMSFLGETGRNFLDRVQSEGGRYAEPIRAARNDVRETNERLNPSSHVTVAEHSDAQKVGGTRLVLFNPPHACELVCRLAKKIRPDMSSVLNKSSLNSPAPTAVFANLSVHLSFLIKASTACAGIDFSAFTCDAAGAAAQQDPLAQSLLPLIDPMFQMLASSQPFSGFGVYGAAYSARSLRQLREILNSNQIGADLDKYEASLETLFERMPQATFYGSGFQPHLVATAHMAMRNDKVRKRLRDRLFSDFDNPEQDVLLVKYPPIPSNHCSCAARAVSTHLALYLDDAARAPKAWQRNKTANLVSALRNYDDYLDNLVSVATGVNATHIPENCHIAPYYFPSTAEHALQGIRLALQDPAVSESDKTRLRTTRQRILERIMGLLTSELRFAPMGKAYNKPDERPSPYPDSASYVTDLYASALLEAFSADDLSACRARVFPRD